MEVYIWHCCDAGETSDPFRSLARCEYAAEQFVNETEGQYEVSIYSYDTKDVEDEDVNIDDCDFLTTINGL